MISNYFNFIYFNSFCAQIPVTVDYLKYVLFTSQLVQIQLFLLNFEFLFEILVFIQL